MKKRYKLSIQIINSYLATVVIQCMVTAPAKNKTQMKVPSKNKIIVFYDFLFDCYTKPHTSRIQI